MILDLINCERDVWLLMGELFVCGIFIWYCNVSIFRKCHSLFSLFALVGGREKRLCSFAFVNRLFAWIRCSEHNRMQFVSVDLNEYDAVIWKHDVAWARIKIEEKNIRRRKIMNIKNSWCVLASFWSIIHFIFGEWERERESERVRVVKRFSDILYIHVCTTMQNFRHETKPYVDDGISTRAYNSNAVGWMSHTCNYRKKVLDKTR